MAGEVPEADALSQLLLHLHRRSPRAVLAVLSEKANGVVANADVGAAATRPGVLLGSTSRGIEWQRKCQ